MGYDDRKTHGNGANTGRFSKPVEVGHEYDVQIIETGKSGDGIAKIQGFVIFVKDAKVGERVKVKINSIGEKFAKAEVVSTD